MDVIVDGKRLPRSRSEYRYFKKRYFKGSEKEKCIQQFVANMPTKSSFTSMFRASNRLAQGHEQLKSGVSYWYKVDHSVFNCQIAFV